MQKDIHLDHYSLGFFKKKNHISFCEMSVELRSEIFPSEYKGVSKGIRK